MGRYSMRNLLPELARCLALMPNLKTPSLQYHGNGDRYSAIGAFAGYSYPSIRTVVTSDYGQFLLRACPEIRHLHETNDFFIDEHIEHAEKLTGMINHVTLSGINHLICQPIPFT